MRNKSTEKNKLINHSNNIIKGNRQINVKITKVKWIPKNAFSSAVNRWEQLLRTSWTNTLKFNWYLVVLGGNCIWCSTTWRTFSHISLKSPPADSLSFQTSDVILRQTTLTETASEEFLGTEFIVPCKRKSRYTS